jgi:8-oxo-dGTP pyrophosphatase MutT (NUDIX family)
MGFLANKQMKEIKDAVGLFMVGNQGKILGVSRKNNPDDMGFPGGKREDDETLEEALIREVEEETKIIVVEPRLFYKVFDGEYNFHVFIAKIDYIPGDLLFEDQNETGVVKWVTFDELKNGTFGSFHVEFEKYVNAVQAELKNYSFI